MAISGKVFYLSVKVFLIRVLSHLGPWARIWKVFCLRVLEPRKVFLLRVLEPQESFLLRVFGPAQIQAQEHKTLNKKLSGATGNGPIPKRFLN